MCACVCVRVCVCVHVCVCVQRELERKAVVTVCRSVVSAVLRGVTTPERASSPAELHGTEDQEFTWKNPKVTLTLTLTLTLTQTLTPNP